MILQCVTCGDHCVSLKSHSTFCKGMSKGKPWLVMKMSRENVSHWKTSAKFQKWARELGVTIPG